MEEIITTNSLKRLLTDLTPYLPRSLYPYHVIRFMLDGKFPQEMHPRVFVDSWPDFELVWVSFMESSKNHPENCLFSMFVRHPTLNQVDCEDFFLKVGKHMDIFSGKNTIFGLFVKQNGLLDTILRVLQNNLSNSLNMEYENQITLWWFPPDKYKARPDFLNIPELTDELYVSRLKPEDAEYVNSTWRHKYPGSDEHIRARIRYLPNIALRRTSDNKLVAWELTAHLGFGNHGYIEPEWRGKNLMKQFAGRMAKERFNAGTIPFGMILYDNPRSMAATRKMYGMEQTKYDVDVVRCLMKEEKAKL